ncbi:cytoplasmic dynein [Naegleria gruberi]|uniref:Cytoplasmic dynein 2 heavy chain 1 n=1 Tax=Naegleria gruberi TaxID=5762 RepID=D2VK63_NAEGR|nr:cytoplasmic dynein [Naegleria gruberi]EFC42807.1 cytoplasmic dynein [Naegleria gruberi]|eukprot:XP_002675551.1 cytoplasmic dynein [Naegleria gruberi strain NEG-M]
MKRLLDVIGGSIGRFIQMKIGQVDIWRDDYLSIKKKLDSGIEICYHWLKTVEELITIWQNEGSHRWKSGNTKDIFIQQLLQRLEEIERIRSSYEQLANNLSAEECARIDCFSPFSGLNPVFITPYSEQSWKSGVVRFEEIIEPLEKRISEKLRTRLSALSSKPLLLLLEFDKNRDLIRRDNVKKELTQERATLLGQLRAHVQTLKADLDNQKYESGTNSDIVRRIVSVKQIEEKIKSTIITAATFLDDLPESTKLQEICNSIQNEVETFINSEKSKWEKEVERAKDDLSLNGSMISLDRNKKMVVNYNERLISLLREVRQLSVLGFQLSSSVLKLAEEAKDFYTQAIALKQIANFYNNVHTQVIKSQSSMLIDAASNFERVIFEFQKEDKSWSKANGEKYIAKLKSAAEQFTTENRKLRKYHILIGDKVAQLMNIDLLREKESWVGKVNEITKIFSFLRTQNYTNMDSWKVHWDYNIYKSLDYQYKVGLETLNEQLPEIKCELVFKDKRVQFSPAFEKIKQTYYEKMRDFIAFPVIFRGLSEIDIFKNITYTNNEGIKTVYHKATILFTRLAKVKKRFADYVILGMVDNELEEIVSQTLNDTNQWEANFRMIKEKGKEIERLENVIKIDCISVSTDTIKDTIQDQLQKLGDLLVKTLRAKTQKHLDVIEQFIVQSLASLLKDPQSMDEIGKSHAYCRKLSEEKSVFYAEFDNFEKKNRLLRSVAGVAIDGSSIKEKWNDFDDTLQAHELYLKDKTNNLQKEVEAKLINFKGELAKFASKWHELKPKDNSFVDAESSKKQIAFIKEKRESFQELRKRGDEILTECSYFGVITQPPKELTEIDEDIGRYEKIWGIYEKFLNDLEKLTSQEWLVFKKQIFSFEDFVMEWISELKEKDKNSITLYIREEIEKYNQFKDYLKFITGDGWQAEHWDSFFRLIGLEKVTVEDLKFGHLLPRSAIIIEKINSIKELSSRATGEQQIRDALNELKAWGLSTEFSTFEYKGNNKVLQLIKEWKDLLTQIGDNQSLAQSIKDSQWAEPFIEEIKSWELKLTNLAEYLDYLMAIQRKWLYLEPIFSRGSLPSEQQRFNRLDKDFIDIITNINDKGGIGKRVVMLDRIIGLKDRLKGISDGLDVCQKALNKFLEEKRSAYPRFYFIGDSDLLEILGQSQNPTVIQTHLKKLYAGIYKVQFNKEQDTIIAMCSSKGEVVQLKQPVKITDKVEQWLANLDQQMILTLQQLLLECDKSKEFDMDAFPSQILCLQESVSFTRKCELAIQNNALPQLLNSVKSQLSQFTSINAKDDEVVSMKVKALILDIIHNIDVVQCLIDGNVSSIQHWLWQKQLRFYIENGKCVIKMSNAKFDYTYEYQGNVSKLVHTPLTDKCYLTLTQGMLLGYGGNPYGPAGTGKTESVKALGHLFGRQVLVFNCDEGIDFNSMGRIFIGLVKCGAWGCFDEFNRLKPDQLSAISQQIQTIQVAIKEKSANPIEILGSKVKVDLNAGIFVTLNPAGKGYGGRSQLPDNLKQLFRAVAMAAPDNELIAEVILLSEGFEHAKFLGKKIVSVFQLSKQLLSSQQHYDWGLRSLKTILNIGGSQIRQSKKHGASLSKEAEAQIVIKALRVNTLSKLTHKDAVLFNGIIKDVFPGIDAPDISYIELERAIKEVMTELGLIPIPNMIKKIVQFYEACKQRMGVVLVGPSGSGKTTIWHVLSEALKKINQKLKSYVVNPKAMPRHQLLGHMDMDTREWFEGIITANSRIILKEEPDVMSWMVCDGDIDPEWVESLNSVLDDNHLLTMPTGERIQFGSNVNFIFETHSLKFASPATVSRMGVIFLSDNDVDVKSFVHAWMNRHEDLTDNLKSLVDNYFYQALDAVLAVDQSEFVIESTSMGIIMNGLSHITPDISTKGEFANSLVKGLGSSLNIKAREKLAKDIYTLCSESSLDLRRPLDYYYSKHDSCYTQYSFTDSEEITYESLQNSPMIRTVDIQRTTDIIYPWLHNMEPFILAGPEGAGKGMLLENLFLDLHSVQIARIHCNSQTNESHVIQKLNQTCAVFTTNTGRVLRPREGERLILFLKDINLPCPDKYGTTQLISFLQQLITYNGYYDDELKWVGLERIQIVCSMNPATTVGRYELTTRFTSIVRIAYMSYTDKQQLKQIVFTYLKCALSKEFSGHAVWKQTQNIDLLTEVMIDLYDSVSKKFTVDEYAHYQFTPRDLTRWILGLLSFTIPASSNRCTELLDAWTYEARRIFRDKLVKDITAFDNMEAAIHMKSNLKKTALQSFERENRPLRLFFIPEIVEYVAMIDRVLCKDGNSLLLVTKQGIGSSDMVALVCHLLKFELFIPKMVVGYSSKHFKNDVKAVIQKAAQNEKVCLILEDHHMTDVSLLEYVNSLLSSGEIPGLFTKEELEMILSSIKDESSREGNQSMSPNAIFIKRVVNNMRIVLLMDPDNSNFDMKCRSNPAIFTKCSIIWKDNWSAEGIQQIPKMIIDENDLKTLSLKPDEFMQLFVNIHDTCTERKATPLHFINFIDTFNKTLQKKRSVKQEQQEHLNKGLSKLKEASKSVDELSKKAEVQKIQLNEKQEQKKIALTEIQKSMQESVKEQNDIEKLKEQVKVEDVKLNEKKSFINGKLSSIEPLLESAKQAVGALTPKEISEIKSLQQPPIIIRQILEGVVRLMGQKDWNSWKGIQNFLNRMGVKDQIMNFDASTVDKKVLDDIKKYLAGEGAESFQPEVAARSSKSALPLAKWVTANVEYAEVLQQVGPLKREMEILLKSQEVLNNQLAQCESKLNTLNEKVKSLQDEYEQKTQEAESLKFGLQQAEKTLSSAKSLIGKLGGEKERWEQQLDALAKEMKDMPYQALLASSFMTYLPDAPENVRKEYIEKWKIIANMKSFDFRSFMSTESEMLQYKGEGLPGDELSTENAIVILESIKHPLIIDPSRRAVEWLKTHLMNKSVECTTSHDTKFSTTLELAVRFGKTLIVEEVDQVDPILYPLLRNEIIVQGTRKSVVVGEKTVDYSEDFKIYLVTRNPNISLTPDASPLVTVVNFTVTKSGLEGQLLSQTLQHENPEIEQKKSMLLKKEEENKIQLSDLEKQLLNELASSKGNLLENESLITKLAEIKKKSQSIVSSLEESSKTMKELETKRDQYRPFAEMGSNLFFIISDMKNINRMYQFSLSSFIKLFDQALTSRLDKASDVNLRITLLKQELSKIAFTYITRSLFKEDRLLFGMHMVRGLFPSMFNQQQWNFFIGNVLKEAPTGTQTPNWIPQDRVKTFQLLSACLPETVSKLQFGNSEKWKHWLTSKEDAVSSFPVPDNSISYAEKVLVIKTLKPDQLFVVITDLVTKTLDIKSLSTSLKLANIHKQESNCAEPILLITTAGADPSQELRQMALDVAGEANFIELAMGQGQTEEAIQLLRKCTREGKWLFLKNLHLVVSWLPTLEKEIAVLSDVNEGFRLWLTTETHDEFPIILLQQSLKLTFESPPGIKQNMLRTFESQNVTEFKAYGKNRMRLSLLLAWFHSVVQERRTYIPQGWSKFYEFSSSDFRAASDIIGAAIENENPEWNTILGLLENAIYGGRIDNKYDAKILRAYLTKYFNPNVLNNKESLYTKGLFLPDNNSYEEYMRFIERLPDIDQPVVFGLPPNADRVVQVYRGNKLIEKLKHIHSMNQSHHSFNKEEWTSKLVPIVQLWNGLVNPNRSVLLQTKRNNEVINDPVDSFITLEMDNSLDLIKFIDSEVQKISEVIKGVSLIDAIIHSNGLSLMGGSIPERWQLKWENGPGDNITVWLNEIVSKTLKLHECCTLVSQGKLFSKPLELNTLFNPHIFFNALKQQTARKSGLQLDDLTVLTASWGNKNISGVSLKVAIKGIGIQGSEFDGTLTSISSDSSPALIELPPCEVYWLTEKQVEDLKQKKEFPQVTLPLPIYYSTNREFTVAELTMPCNSIVDVDKFILTGTALFVDTQ